MRLTLIAMTLLLAGCSTDAAVIRITEYRADTPLSALAGSGIAVHQSGRDHAFADVDIVYRGDRAVITISGSGADAVSE